MSSAGLQIASVGPEDRWFTSEPERTFFEVKYKPQTNRTHEANEIPFDNINVPFGSRVACTLPNKGDFLTRLTLRATLPPIYPTESGEYVFPAPSSQVGGNVYAQKTLTLVVADGVTLTANTIGNHYLSIGAQVILTGTGYSIFDLDGTYTVATIPTANSFTCSTTLAGVSYRGTMSFVAIACADIVSYFATQNSNLWVNNLTNKTWAITGATNVGNVFTFTTSTPSNFPVESQIVLNLPASNLLNQDIVVNSSSEFTFNINVSDIKKTIVIVRNNEIAYSTNNGQTWTHVYLAAYFLSVAYGNGTFVSTDFYGSAYSPDYGHTWVPSNFTTGAGYDYITYGDGLFVAFAITVGAYSSDKGQTWAYMFFPSGSYNWISIAVGNNTFVIVGQNFTAYSTDIGGTWTTVSTPGISWNGSIYGNGVFIASSSDVIAYSTDNGQSWTPVSLPGTWGKLAYGNGTFITTGSNAIAYSTDDGHSWTTVTLPGTWGSISYGTGTFVTIGTNVMAYSTDNGQTWTTVTLPEGNWTGVACSEFLYTSSFSDSVSLVVPPLQLSGRTFSSNAYPSIEFLSASDAAFWGFDPRYSLTYPLPATPPWTYTQAGWVSGFLPPSSSTWDDSVAHKLCKSIRLLLGKQTIKEYSGEYVELRNDLLVPYENKAILKLMNGTLDPWQAITSREYYVSLPMGTHEFPLCALTQQQMSVEIDFEEYYNLSENLNQGTGSFVDEKSFTTFDASALLSPVNVQTTFSYQQYIFVVTYDGKLIVYDTTQSFTDPASYNVISALAGSNNLKQFCVLAGNLYIGVSDGQLIQGILEELLQKNTSSFILNNYTPTFGSLTGTLVADFRYVYYSVSNTVTSNVFMTRYDTTGSFTSPSSYTSVDFSATFNSNVTGVYQTLSTGTELIMIPRGVTGTLYTFQLNANVQSQWYTLDYATYGHVITEGVITGNSIYFVTDDFILLEYTNSIFTVSTFLGIFIAVGYATSYTYDNIAGWIPISIPGGGYGNITYGNGVFVAIGDSVTSYSNDNGKTWITSNSPTWVGITYGNGIFVAVYPGLTGYSIDNGQTWTLVPLYGVWLNVTYGNGIFVAVGFDNTTAYSNDNGQTWTLVPLYGHWASVTYGNGTFVAVGGNYTAYSNDSGQTWSTVYLYLGGYGWNSVAYGNGTFITVNYQTIAYSDNNGQSWTLVSVPEGFYWNSVAYGNGIFVSVSENLTTYSKDNGRTWTNVLKDPGTYYNIAYGPQKFTIPGDGFKNLMAMGNYIYCSTSNVAVRIDTTQDLSTQDAYEYPAPLPVSQYVMAHGPRYVYLFTQDSTQATTQTNITRFDPYGANTTFQASIIADYESLPSGTPKPDKAVLPLVQSQKVTDMTHMDLKGPIKELWFTGPASSVNVFDYSDLASQSVLSLTSGEPIVTEDVGTRTFLNTIQPFETHTAMPIRNVSVVSFEMNPESEVPDGTVNFSRIKDQVFEGGAQTAWADSVNLLAIQGGIGGLIFDS